MPLTGFPCLICYVWILSVEYSELQVLQKFQELFMQTKYKEATELATESPQGLRELRNPDTVAKF